MTDFDASDIAAMRKQGDLREFLRQQMRPRAEVSRPATPPRPPGHRTGTWPTGTSPPSSRPSVATDAQWAQALEGFRADRGSDHDPCQCGACPPPNKTREENR
ncbi:hypothetical protein ACWGMA_08365 [Streptomyces asiaticus]